MALSDEPQRQFGRYKLLCRLASGGMADLYLARLAGQDGFEQLIAVKVIHPHLTSQPEFVQMFIDEARLAARISHPNVLQVLDLDRVGGTRTSSRWSTSTARASPRSSARPPGRSRTRARHRRRRRRAARGARAARRRRPAARGGAPRRLAAEHPDRLRRRGEGGRLRRRHARGSLHDHGSDAQGQVRVHVARAVLRPARRRPAHRRLRARHRALRGDHLAPPLQGRDRGGDGGEGAARADRAPVEPRPEATPRSSRPSCCARSSATRRIATRPRRSSTRSSSASSSPRASRPRPPRSDA